VGRHSEFENVFVIAGLGTKGASLAPYCARILANAIINDAPIPPEVDILRHETH
jgi:glycine/D-amino acid oxidase-like deaminating enzyme